MAHPLQLPQNGMGWRNPYATPHPADLRSRNLRLAESQFSMCCGLPFPSGKGPGVGARKSQAKTQTDAWFRFFVSTNPSVAPQKRGGGFADATLCEKQQPRRLAPITPLWPAAHTRPQKLPSAGFSPMLQSTQSSLVLLMPPPCPGTPPRGKPQKPRSVHQLSEAFQLAIFCRQRPIFSAPAGLFLSGRSVRWFL